ncbi:MULTISPECIES: CPBP family intramembrane glutamic endopeptidase [unclassified Micromonospora]|uniref:CPBP family intramembrane glutamic endopeptidase n=1 Tax=unclassified Micromonospora TaxID=2617518 RepID=UPI00103522F5|nr:type II CAAX endopeptidase family protein [Verrucosispora sp. SN26_14.1]TBL35208.1 CPBP family intramembrane metalloprotease [Verrucosispora sp. SN26_14.1]
MAVDTVVQTKRPGWPEILVGLAVMALVGYGLPIALDRTGAADGLSPVTSGLILAALSGVAGLIAFAAAARIRSTNWSDLGVRPTTGRWLLIGVAGGLVALVVSRIVAAAVYYLTGPAENIQQPYLDAAGGGILTLILSFLFLAVLTPIGEEFLFRGIVTTALLRYGAVVGVVGSSLIFALMHGLNLVFVTALVVGLVAAEVFRRSGSIWPAVAVHVTNNLLGQVLALLVAGAS